MGRSRASAKQAGTKFERLVADYLNAHVSEYIDRRVKTGGKDKGDVANVRFVKLTDGMYGYSGRITVETKDCATVQLGPWLNEAETERVNDDADVGLVVFKAHGKGAPGDQRVVMTLRDLATLLAGRRPADA